MNRMDLFRSLKKTHGGKMLLIVIDGLGGLPRTPRGKTELETARKPNLDALARESVCGLHYPCAPGLTPGSGAAHLGLFGYDPFEFLIGRGVFEALGIDFPLCPGDIAIRANFCTVDEKGIVIDRRAGRIDTEFNARLCAELRNIRLKDIELFVEPVKEHRAVIVFRGSDLHAGMNDSDPGETGQPPLEVKPLCASAHKAAGLCNAFVDHARVILRRHHPANMVLLRGIDRYQPLPDFADIFGPKAAAIASYPMYRGLARLVGMDVLDTGETVRDEVETLEANFLKYDFFYLHVKKTDSYGEDGEFGKKVHVIEEWDRLMPRVRRLGFDVIALTGDHSTPAALKGHSWHPVPTLLWSKVCLPDDVRVFGERACARGGLGLFEAIHLVPLMLANAGRLQKYGA